ncbi:MAG: SUMF1/EgtB/PvdO family nonheme iron enzyme [Candidatus Entotheonellia bacterium]
MILDALLSAALEAGLGLIAEAGFGDAIHDLKDRLTNATERKRRESFERAFAQARKVIDDAVLTPLLEHRPFQEAVVSGLLDPEQGFSVQAVADDWQDRLPKHALSLRKFFNTLERLLWADDTWGPILERFHEQRVRDEVQQALKAQRLDLTPGAVVQRVSAALTGSGAIATEGGTAAGAGGVAVGGNVGQIVLQQIVMQSGARADSGNLRQRYLSRLRLQCGNLPLDVFGGDVDPREPVTLDQVYIELNTTTSVPANVLEQIQQGAFGQWSDVESVLRATPYGSLCEEHLRDQGSGERDDAGRLLPALDAFRLSPDAAFLGDPGAGKSTFARIVIARLIDGTPPPGVSSELLPVLVVLRDLAQRLVTIDLNALPGARHAGALADAVRDQMLADLAGLEAQGFAEDLREALNAQRCLPVFDGLDEVPQASRGLVRRAVIAAINRYRPPRVIVTCRIRSYLGDAMLPGFDTFTLAPFDRHQIATFAHAWYNAQRERGRVDAVRAEQKATDLAETALKPALRELAANPMLLTTMAIIHQQDTRLPEERVCLYDRAVTLLLHRWERERVANDALAAVLGDGRRLRQVMERLAYETHRTARQGQPGEAADLPRHAAQDIIEEYLGDANQARAFLDYVDQQAGLLIGRDGTPGRPDTYTFPHRTFQEYLAGCYLLTGSESERVERFYECAAEGDRWSLVAQLGAEELLYNNIRNGERELFYLADNLLHNDLLGLPLQRAALWSGQIALLAGRARIDRGARIPHSGEAYIRRLVTQMKTLLASDLTAPERCQAGEVLGHFGDPRFRPEAWYLPDEPLLGFVEVPAGPFVMGSNYTTPRLGEDFEMPQHEITLPRYYIARYPVTVEQYRAFVQESGYKPTGEEWLCGLSNYPVVHVSWYDAIAYCKWVTERLRECEGTPAELANLLRQEGWCVTLPSEAEWEKAARGMDGRKYPWGNDLAPHWADFLEIPTTGTRAVGCFRRGASPYQVQEMNQTVSEWTRTLWGKTAPEPAYRYPYDPADGRENLQAPDRVLRVLRGAGLWHCAARGATRPIHRSHDVGFRVVVRPCH